MGKIVEKPTRALADFVANLKYEDIPAEVVETAKTTMVDAFGLRSSWNEVRRKGMQLDQGCCRGIWWK